MADHTRHSLARTGALVRPSSIQTLAQFLDTWAQPKAAPVSVIVSLVEQALQQFQISRFAQVSDFRSFHQSLAQLIEEAHGLPLAGDWAKVRGFVERELSDRGLAVRNARLRSAANALEHADGLPFEQITFDGFFTLSPSESNLILACTRHAGVRVILPDSLIAHSVRELLTARGFAEEPGNAARDAAPQTVVAAPTIVRESEEIARRILAYVAEGRRFRDIGVILRSREPYAPLLETTLARFGIPARFYFSDPLSAHPAIAHIARVMRSALAGWDHDLLLAALRMPVSGLGATPEGDRLDFDWRERLPARGIPTGDITTRFSALDQWTRETLAPEEWSARLTELRAWIPAPTITDHVDRDQIHVWRSTALALDTFEAALSAAALAMPRTRPVRLTAFWREVETVLALEPLRIPDRRRDVVHVMDVFEARQWELPVIFVPGLTERHFPQYHREDPLLGEAERYRLGLETALDRQNQERSLFDFALTRAAAEVILSFPRFDDKGEELLPSFFLPDASKAECCETRVRPRPLQTIAAPPSPVIQDPLLLEKLGSAHTRLSATSIESFLQCPFQFFGRRTLRLKPRPAAARDRLDVLLQGTIVHRALAEWIRAPLLGQAIFDRVFDEECELNRVPRTYRTEAVRLEMLRAFESFIADEEVRLTGPAPLAEEKFEYALSSELSISGRIDRLERTAAGALVIDYKYSAADKIRDRVKNTDEGDQAQAGLYLSAAERVFNLKPAGVLFCGLKKEVTWDGWHVPIAGLESIGTACQPERLRELAETAEQTAIRVHESILTGAIRPQPADTDKCRWCDYVDACRIETVPAIRKAGAQ